MYEFSQKFRRNSRLQGLGTDDDVTPGRQLALDYRAGAKTASEIQGICLGVSSVDRYHTDYDECRWFLTPEDLCFRENNNRECSVEQLRQQCFFTPQNLRNSRCASYMEMTPADGQASGAGPETGASALQRAAGAVAGYRERVAQAAEDVVRSVRPVDANVQAIQRAVLAGGCVLPRYGADGRWGSETEAGVRCLAQQQGWNTVMMQYPWLAQRIQVPAQQVADASSTTKPSGVVTSIAQILPAVSPPTSINTASIFSSLGIGSLPSWAPWAIAGAGFLSVMALGFYIARKRG